MSDKTRSRWGRRHPYMYAAVLPLAPLFWLVFNPPDGLRAAELFVWLAGFSFLLRCCLSLYSVSSNAMAAELTRNYDERTEVLGYRFLFGWIAGLAVAIIGFTAFFSSSAGGLVDGRLSREAYEDFAWFCGVVAAAAVLVCARGTHAAIPALRQPAASQVDLRSFGRELREVYGSRSFRALFGSVIVAAAAWGYINSIGFYLNTYFWGLSAGELGLLTLVMFGSVAIAFFAAPALGRWSDKRRAAITLKAIGILLGPAPILLRYLDWMPANHTSALLFALMLHTLVLTAIVIAVQILGASMVADLTDQGELLHGERREGLYSAVVVFGIKASTGIGGLLAGATLDLVRFPRQLDIARVPAGTVDALGYTVAPALMLTFALSLFLLLGYRLDRTGHQRIVQDLAAPRG